MKEEILKELQELKERILLVIPEDLEFGFAGEDISTAKYLSKNVDDIIKLIKEGK